jgi:hypothetical protein
MEWKDFSHLANTSCWVAGSPDQSVRTHSDDELEIPENAAGEVAEVLEWEEIVEADDDREIDVENVVMILSGLPQIIITDISATD